VHNNYYFLAQLSVRLKQTLKGFRVVSCFSQNKDELIIEFNNSSTSFFIKASLLANFCCLSFPKNFSRARKNSIDLFNDVLMKKVLDVRQFENERSFSVQLEDSYSLLFKMHGNRSNVILFKGDDAISLFRNHQVADKDLILSELDRTIDWSKESFEKNIEKLPSPYFTFGKWVWLWLEERDFKTKDLETQWIEFNKLKSALETPLYFITKYQGNQIFSLLPLGEIIKTFSDPIEAINDFFHSWSVADTLHSEKAVIRKQLSDQIKSGKNYLEKTQSKLDELLQDNHYQLWGDLIMAHMHEMKTGMEAIQLNNFYDNTLVNIKLKKDLNPQKNAEVFYRKAKNKQIEIDKLKEAIKQKKIEIEKWNHSLETLEATEDLKEVRRNSNPVLIGNKNTEKSLPFFEFEHKGFRILVGKNAESNDHLTLKHSYKEDLWLHAKDVPGSHVIIKHQSGKPFPKDVIERAAQLAAYNSKRKTETLCPVAFTPKKYVRKRKGDPAGAVVVEREDVIMVEPKL
jgi:predicted ribosome quality control (RQC) complex YloA/Tae2 family protein